MVSLDLFLFHEFGLTSLTNVHFWHYTYFFSFFSNNVAAASGLNTVQDIFNMF